MATDKIAVVDFSAYGLDRDEPDQKRFQKLIDEVYSALTTTGFIYLTNTGISKAKIDRAFEVSKKFFYLPEEEKLYCALPKKHMHGYICMGRESAYKLGTVVMDTNTNRVNGDVGQGFNFYPGSSDLKQAWPENLPEFREGLEGLMTAAMPVLHRLLEVIARALKCKDAMFFTKAHMNGGKPSGGVRIRTNFYPAIHNMDLQDDQIRCGEHTDFGSVTMLFQQGQGGLQVQKCQDVWIPAPPIDDTIVINVGDLMQRWTSDRIIATKHRVIMPTTEEDKRKDRQTIAFHGFPDVGTIIECIDGSNKYPPIEESQYARQQYGRMIVDKAEFNNNTS